MLSGEYELALEAYEAGILNAIKLTEKYPDLLIITDLDVETKTIVETYQVATTEIQKQKAETQQ